MASPAEMSSLMVAHVLVVYDDGDDGRSYFLEHPENCPYEHDDSFVVGGKFHTCVEGDLWACAGEEGVPDADELPTGRYPLRVKYEHTPSTPNGPAETDAWLEVVRD